MKRHRYIARELRYGGAYQASLCAHLFDPPAFLSRALPPPPGWADFWKRAQEEMTTFRMTIGAGNFQRIAAICFPGQSTKAGIEAKAKQWGRQVMPNISQAEADAMLSGIIGILGEKQ